MQFIKIVSLIAVLFMAAFGVKAENPGLDILSKEEFKNRLAEDPSAYLLDVPTPDEFFAGHIAVLISSIGLIRRHSKLTQKTLINRR